MVQIETKEGVENMKDIAAVDGIGSVDSAYFAVRTNDCDWQMYCLLVHMICLYLLVIRRRRQIHIRVLRMWSKKYFA